MTKKCALCSCLDEKDSATCWYCGEATWLVQSEPIEMSPEPGLELVPVESTSEQPKKRSRK